MKGLDIVRYTVAVGYGNDVRSVGVEADSTLGDAIIATGLSVEQPCAGRGTCLKCKVMAEGALAPLDEHELAGLSSAERAAHYRLACRARVAGDVSVTLAPIVVYSNKIFRACDDHRRAGVPLGLAIDLGSTTVAAFVTTLGAGRVCAGLGRARPADGLRRGCDLTPRRGAERSGDRRACLGAGAFLDRAGGGRAQAGAQRPGAHPQGHHRRQLCHAPPAAALSCRYAGRDPFSTPRHRDGPLPGRWHRESFRRYLPGGGRGRAAALDRRVRRIGRAGLSDLLCV